MKSIIKIVIATSKCVALCTVAFVFVGTQMGSPMTFQDPAPVEQNKAAVLLEKHEKNCWTSEQDPKTSDIPSHVIWQHSDGRVVYSKKLAGPALDAMFGDGQLRGTPIAFCVKGAHR